MGSCSRGGNAAATVPPPPKVVPELERNTEGPRECQPQHYNRSDLWNDETRAGLALAVRVFEGRLTPNEAEEISRGFLDLSKHWEDAARRACSIYLLDETQSAKQHIAAVECLDGVVVDAVALITSVGAGNLDRIRELPVLKTRIEDCLGQK
jgi:hypothetical protein